MKVKAERMMDWPNAIDTQMEYMATRLNSLADIKDVEVGGTTGFFATSEPEMEMALVFNVKPERARELDEMSHLIMRQNTLKLKITEFDALRKQIESTVKESIERTKSDMPKGEDMSFMGEEFTHLLEDKALESFLQDRQEPGETVADVANRMQNEVISFQSFVDNDKVYRATHGMCLTLPVEECIILCTLIGGRMNNTQQANFRTFIFQAMKEGFNGLNTLKESLLSIGKALSNGRAGTDEVETVPDLEEEDLE